MSQTSISNSLLNIVLVIAESTMTLILRFDANLRRAVYPLAKKNIIVCIRTYLPHTQIYATFTNKGILLDSELPEGHREADIVVNTYSHQLINTLISNDVRQVEKLTMRGATETIMEFRNFLIQLGLATLFQSIIKTIKGTKGEKDKKKAEEESKKIDYKAKITEQQQQITKLSTFNRQLEISLKEEQSKQRMTFIGFVVASVIAIVSIVALVL